MARENNDQYFSQKNIFSSFFRKDLSILWKQTGTKFMFFCEDSNGNEVSMSTRQLSFGGNLKFVGGIWFPQLLLKIDAIFFCYCSWINKNLPNSCLSKTLCFSYNNMSFATFVFRQHCFSLNKMNYENKNILFTCQLQIIFSPHILKVSLNLERGGGVTPLHHYIKHR